MAYKDIFYNGAKNKKHNPQEMEIKRLGITGYYTGGNQHWIKVLLGTEQPKNMKQDPIYLLERIKQRILFLKKYNPTKTLNPEHYLIDKNKNPTLYNLFLNPEQFITKYSSIDCLSPTTISTNKSNKSNNNNK